MSTGMEINEERKEKTKSFIKQLRRQFGSWWARRRRARPPRPPQSVLVSSQELSGPREPRCGSAPAEGAGSDSCMPGSSLALAMPSPPTVILNIHTKLIPPRAQSWLAAALFNLGAEYKEGQRTHFCSRALSL